MTIREAFGIILALIIIGVGGTWLFSMQYKYETCARNGGVMMQDWNGRYMCAKVKTVQ